MNRVYGIAQLLLSVLLVLIVGATVVNAILIAGRPETISVVNAMIGHLVMIVGCLALARILQKKALNRLRAKPGASSPGSSPGSASAEH